MTALWNTSGEQMQLTYEFSGGHKWPSRHTAMAWMGKLSEEYKH